MKYFIGALFIVAGFAFMNQPQPLDGYDIIGVLLMIIGFYLGDKSC